MLGFCRAECEAAIGTFNFVCASVGVRFWPGVGKHSQLGRDLSTKFYLLRHVFQVSLCLSYVFVTGILFNCV